MCLSLSSDTKTQDSRGSHGHDDAAVGVEPAAARGAAAAVQTLDAASLPGGRPRTQLQVSSHDTRRQRPPRETRKQLKNCLHRKQNLTGHLEVSCAEAI